MSRSLWRSALALSAAAALALTAAGCSSSEGEYVNPGKLTVATGDIAYYPYVIDDKPESGEGFEAALVYAIAAELGFEPDEVEWVRTSFESAIAPGPKNYDFNIQQYTITEERLQAVDFSSPYYSASQAVVAVEGGAADGASSIADLKDLKLGAMAGSTSAATIEEVVAPNVDPGLYGSNEDAVAALTSNQIDAIVLDLPTAFFATGVYIDNSFIVGELPVGGVPDEWGILLPKDSPLTEKVDAALATLTENGTLADITDKWLGSGQGVVLLQ